MTDKKTTPTDLRKQAQQLIESGRMPSLDEVLQAVFETRRESGEGKREFAELLKQDWLESDLCSQWFECRMISCAEPGWRSLAVFNWDKDVSGQPHPRLFSYQP